MAGAYGNNLREEIPKLIGELTSANTAVGGSTMAEVRDRVLDVANSELRGRITIFWDGSHNGLVTVDSYVDLLEEAINALGHQRFVIIPPINPYGSTYSASQSEAIYTEMNSRWPNNVLHWNTILVNSSNSIAQSMFHDALSDTYHLSRLGARRMAVGVVEFLISKGWVANPGDDWIESAGSVWLVDPSNAEGTFAGVPANNDSIPNVVWGRAATLIGSGDSSTLATRVQVADNGVDSFFERTSKLGFHAILSQDAPYSDEGSSRQGMSFGPDQLLQEYIDSTTEDDWYFSIWYKCTREHLATKPGGGSNGAPQSLMHKARNTSSHLFHMGNLSPAPTSGGNLLGRERYPTTNGYTDGELTLRAIATAGYTGTKEPLGDPAWQSNRYGLRVVLGSDDAWGFFNDGAAPSGILYRAYAENLTESGRTFDQVMEIDKLLFDVAFGEGGAFYDDSFSDPDTALA